MSNPASKQKMTVLYDGACPLCSREIRFLKNRDKQNLIEAVDIAAPGFDPKQYGRSHEALDARIHAFLPDGTCVTGVEVFRQLYDRIGLGWTVRWTKLPIMRPLANRAYDAFARNRHYLTGRNKCKDATCSPRRKGKPTVIPDTRT